ncbi:YcaO-like family protein [Streptomyces rimosus]|uniref:YcaO-like family protein n=1 Tax=Streptomyces rimosus TaxID=1927 RepID=UPI00067B466E|nr:YcaO-like family protein [Streptomyces rimosus]
MGGNGGAAVTVLSSSVREAPAVTTCAQAWPVARRLGVSRIAETTHLDRIGIPVAAAVRPRAELVVVTAGKGHHPHEARAGALMEAVEQAVAERCAATTPLRWASPRAIADEGGVRLGAWCPRPERTVDVDQPLPWITMPCPGQAREITVPAELVLTPCPLAATTGLFGSTTTGLASGTSHAEAVLHGLCEVLERDVTSLMSLRDTSRLVLPDTLPPGPAELYGRIRAAGLGVWLRWLPAYGGHYMACLIDDPDSAHPLYCNGGYGYHPWPEIAAVRALAEAAQSRLTYLQGSRQDLPDHYATYAVMTPRERDDWRTRLLDRYARSAPAAAFPTAPLVSAGVSPQTLLTHLLARVAAAGLGPVGVHSFAPLAEPFHVVRVVVARAEHLTAHTRRFGSRLAAHVREGR